MVTVKNPPFSRSDWTHVVFTFDNVNSSSESPSVASLYVNGKLQGAVRQPLVYKWDLSKVAIMLGIEYIGDLDDLMIFRRAITAGRSHFSLQVSGKSLTDEWAIATTDIFPLALYHIIV